MTLFEYMCKNNAEFARLSKKMSFYPGCPDQYAELEESCRDGCLNMPSCRACWEQEIDDGTNS